MAGQVLAEACVGLALLTFVWILFSFVGYMSNNHLRTLMASRYAAWLSGNDQDPQGASIPQQFFYGDDTNLVTVQSAGLTLSLTGAITGSLPSQAPTELAQQGQNAWQDTVTFGLQLDSVANTTKYPFTLMNSQVPFMTNSLLTNFTLVSSSDAWPADVQNSWQNLGQAIEGVLSALLGEADSALGGFGAVLGALGGALGSL
jgi:hypothetical protein